MQTILLVIYLMVVVALIGVVLIQRSEGGGLGIGGGSGFMSARGTANALTRTTAILATLFFVLALGMGILARYQTSPIDILDRIPGTTGTGGVLDAIGGGDQNKGTQENQGTQNSTTNQTPATTGTEAVPTEGSAATGTASAPTPLGTFFVDGIVRLDPPHRAYGVGQVSFTGFSEVYESFGGGVGQVAMHGTQNPALIGTPASHGCVRLRNEDILRVMDLAPTGTPVEVIA